MGLDFLAGGIFVVTVFRLIAGALTAAFAAVLLADLGALAALARAVDALAGCAVTFDFSGIRMIFETPSRDLQNNSSKKTATHYFACMGAFFIRWMVITVAVFAAEKLIPGIHCGSLSALLAASLLLGIINAFVRPVLLLLSIPFILVTMGLFIFVINALLLLFVSMMIPAFEVHGFWNAFFGAIVIGIVNWILSSFFRSSDGKYHAITHHPSIKPANARVVE